VNKVIKELEMTLGVYMILYSHAPAAAMNRHRINIDLIKKSISSASEPSTCADAVFSVIIISYQLTPDPSASSVIAHPFLPKIPLKFVFHFDTLTYRLDCYRIYIGMVTRPIHIKTDRS